MNAENSAALEHESQVQYWWLFLIQGIIVIIIGWLLLVNPVITTLSLVSLLGLYWLISGIVDVIFSLFEIGHKGSRWGWKLFGGIIGIIAGLFIVNNQLVAGILTPVMLMYIIAFTFVINGIVNMVVGSASGDDGHHEWSWASFFMGLFYLIFGFILLTSPVLFSTASLIFAAGLLSIVGGIGAIILSFRLRSEKKQG